MSEAQLKAAKAAETEKVEAQVEDAVEEISEEDLGSVAGAEADAAQEEKEEVIEEVSEDDLEGVTGGVSLGGSGGRLMNGAGIPNFGQLFDQRE